MMRGSMPTIPWGQSLYRRLIVTSDQECCKLSAQARWFVANNFVLMLASLFFSKLADVLSNPKIVLPWVMETVHALLSLLGFLVSIRESGALIPQVLIAGSVKRLARRKWVWVTGKMVDVAAMPAIALVAWLAEGGGVAGWRLLLLLVVFSLARGFCSVASKNVTGKTWLRNGWQACGYCPDAIFCSELPTRGGRIELFCWFKHSDSAAVTDGRWRHGHGTPLARRRMTAESKPTQDIIAHIEINHCQKNGQKHGWQTVFEKLAEADFVAGFFT